jgi:hypothetical protein
MSERSGGLVLKPPTTVDTESHGQWIFQPLAASFWWALVGQ